MTKTKTNIDCAEHDFVFIESKNKSDASGGYNIRYTRIDRFYCRKCLQQREIVKEEWCRNTPEWW